MANLRRRHDRWPRPIARAGARYAWIKALGLLAATAVGASLLARWLNVPWPPVLVSVIVGLPAIYVALLAIPDAIERTEPGAARKLTYGRLPRAWAPVELGVHPVIGGGPMPAYVRRPHDEVLRAVLDPTVAASRLVVVRGGSSTGKTRAAYEAVADRFADWQVDYPLNAAALAARLDAGIPARTVLWLGELRQYADDDNGAAVLGRLADLLKGTGHVLITTMWPEHWNAYAAAASVRLGASDPAGVIGRLLAPLPDLTNGPPSPIDPGRGGVIDVPSRFTRDELEAAARTGDSMLAAAAAAAAGSGHPGQVPQYLAGVPELVDRYCGIGGDPYGQAIITASMDATRLGHANPLPAALICEAAVGYLTGPQRTKDIASWRDAALAWAAEELKGAVRALQPVPPPSGTGVAGYRVAGYLDQEGRRTRQDQPGLSSLWDALATHAATVRDQVLLGQAAEKRGLYRYAATLWTTAAASGNASAAQLLITLLRRVSPDDTMPAGRWAAGQASLDNPYAVGALLRELRETAANDAVTTLATRAASHAPADNPSAIAFLLGALHETGASDATATLAAKAASLASLDDQRAVARLLGALHETGADDAVTTLATRAARDTLLDDPYAVGRLLGALRQAGADDAVTTLATRAARDALLDDPSVVTRLLGALRQAGASDAVTTLLARDPAARVSLRDPSAVGALLRALLRAGADDAVSTLLARDPAARVSLDDPRAVAFLLGALRRSEARDAVTALAARSASHVPLDEPQAVTSLLEELREAQAHQALITLATRAASDTELKYPHAVARLLEELHQSGVGDAVTTLAARAASRAPVGNPSAIAFLLEALRETGADAAFAILATRAATQAPLHNPYAVARLLEELRKTESYDAIATLLARNPTARVFLDSPIGVARLMRELREAGSNDAAAILASRAASDIPLEDPRAIVRLLEELREIGNSDAIVKLLARVPASRISLDDPSTVDLLLEEMRKTQASDAVVALASRAADAGMFELYLKVIPGTGSVYAFGRQPDGTPLPAWRWHRPDAATTMISE